MAEETNGVTPQVSGQTLAAADASVKGTAAAAETNKTLTGVHSIIIDLEELQKEYYETANDYFETAQELFGSILESLVALKDTVVSTNEEDKKETNKKPKTISKTITIDQVIQYNDSSAAAAVLLCNKLDALFGNKKEKKKEDNGAGGIEELLAAAGAGAPALLIIAGSMLLFAAGAALFAKVNWGSALLGVGFFALFVAGTLAISIALKKEQKNLKQFAMNVLMMTGALALFAATIWFVSKINDTTNWRAVLGTLGLFVAFVAGVVFLGRFVKQEEGTFRDFAIGTIMMVAALVVFTSALLFITWVYEKIDFKSVGIVTLMFLGFVLAIALIAKVANGEMAEFMKFGVTVAIMTADLMLFALALKEIQALDLLKNIGTTIATLGLFIVFVGLMALIANFANTQMAQFALFAVASALMIGALMLFTLAIKFAATVQMKDLFASLAVVGTMVLFVAAFAALGLALTVMAPIIFPGLATALVVSGMVLAVVAAFSGVTRLVKELVIDEEAFNKLYSIESLINVIADIDWHPLKMIKATASMVPAFTAVGMISLMVNCLQGITKLEIDQGKITFVMDITKSLIETLSDYADEMKGLGIAASVALGVALGGITKAMLDITEVLKRLQDVTPEDVQKAAVNLQYIMSKIFLKGTDPLNEPTLMDVLMAVPEMSDQAVAACGALPNVTAALNNIADVILKVKDLSPEEISSAVTSVLAMADCLANCSGFFKAIAENSSYGGFLGFGKKDTFKTVDEKLDAISSILSKVISVFSNLGTVDPAGVESISTIFSRMSQIDESFAFKSAYFAEGLNHISNANIRGLMVAFEGLDPNNIPLAMFITTLKPVEEVGKPFVTGAKYLRDGINYIAGADFKSLGQFRIEVAEINPDPFTRLAVAMDSVVSNALKLKTINKELGRLTDHLKDVYNASSKFKKTFDLGSITSNAIDRAHSWLEGVMNKDKEGQEGGKDDKSYISRYLQDGNDITRQMLELLNKWEKEGVLIREPKEEEENDIEAMKKGFPGL